MEIARDIESLRSFILGLRQSGGSIGFVPTMGALHAGHISLVEAAKKHCDYVVASIFVNPTQFGPNEDLDAYPRQLEEDCKKLESRGVAVCYAPTPEVMYPDGYATNIHVAGVSEGLCGAARPGHFDGVAMVVTKLFMQVLPDAAFFGQKDYQQLQVIRRMVKDLDMPLEIIGVPTMRESDGLAMSSRNAYLTPEERAIAPALYATLQEAAKAANAGQEAAPLLEQARNHLLARGFASVDYIELRDSASLAPISIYQGVPARLLVAARLGKTRLIDNIAVE